MKKIILYFAAFVVGTSSLLIVLTGHASAATATWDGGGSDTNMMTAANWGGDVAPTAGDDLVFPAGVSKKTVVNDFTAGTSFNSITFSGSTTNGEADYTISGNAIALVDGITTDFGGQGGLPTISLNMTLSGQVWETSQNNTITVSGTVDIGSSSVTWDGTGNTKITGVISGSGTIAKDGGGTLTLSGANTSFSGPISDSLGVIVVADKDALGTSAGVTTVNDGARIEILLPQAQKSSTISEPLTIHAAQFDPGSGDLLGVLAVNSNCGLSACQDSDITLSGTLTITTDVRIDSDATTRITGTISGAHDIKLSEGQYGTLVINSSSNGSSTANGTYEAEVTTHTISTTNASQTLNIYKNVIDIVTGTVGSVRINKLGTLKGTGTVGTLYLGSEGTLAPGMSPGILNTGNLTYEGGTQQVELGGTASGEYDQVNVTGTVDLGTTTTLATTMYNGYTPVVGNSYTIINNDGSDAITGHFSGLTEGSSFNTGGYLFKISYVGGDGNDVVLTVQPIPTTPDTGFGLLKTNPLLAMFLLCAVTPLLVIAARRTARVTVK